MDGWLVWVLAATLIAAALWFVSHLPRGRQRGDRELPDEVPDLPDAVSNGKGKGAGSTHENRHEADAGDVGDGGGGD